MMNFMSFSASWANVVFYPYHPPHTLILPAYIESFRVFLGGGGGMLEMLDCSEIDIYNHGFLTKYGRWEILSHRQTVTALNQCAI